MSMHKHICNTPELRKALACHGLKVDTPSQLSDSFRIGWLSREAENSATCTPRPMSEAPRDGAVILGFYKSDIYQCPFPVKWNDQSNCWGVVMGLEWFRPDEMLGWLPCPTYTGEAV